MEWWCNCCSSSMVWNIPSISEHFMHQVYQKLWDPQVTVCLSFLCHFTMRDTVASEHVTHQMNSHVSVHKLTHFSILCRVLPNASVLDEKHLWVTFLLASIYNLTLCSSSFQHIEKQWKFSAMNMTCNDKSISPLFFV